MPHSKEQDLGIGLGIGKIRLSPTNWPGIKRDQGKLDPFLKKPRVQGEQDSSS